MIESPSTGTERGGLTRNEKLLLGLMACLLLAGTIIFILTASLSAWDFRNNLWGPTHLLVTERDPYRILQLFDGSNSVWMPTTVGASFLLGYLKETTATNLWAVLNLTAYLGIIALSLPFTGTGEGKRKPSPVWLAVALTGALLFPPFVSLMILGQIGVITTLLLLLAVIILPRNIGAAAFLVALVSAKPQLLMLGAFGLLIAAYRLRGWRGVGRYILYGLLWSALMTLPLWIAYPDWLDGFQAALESNPTWAQPSSLSVLRVSLGNMLGVLAWLVLVAGVMVATFRLWWFTDNYRTAMICSLALTVIVTPYVWTWDFVLMVPALVWTLFSVRTVWPRLLLVTGYVIAWGLTIHIRLTTDNSDIRFWWLSWLLLATIAGAWWVSRWATTLALQKNAPDVVKVGS